MGIRGPLAGGRTFSPLARSFGWAAFVGAYDAFTASLAHVYEPARRTLTSYTGNLLRLRRASDDAESDFGYVANGDLDTATIAAWLGGSSGYVVSVYDQKNGDTITQSTKTVQPLYVASAQNGHAGMYFDGTNDNMSGAFTNGGILSQPLNIFTLAQLDITAVNAGYKLIFSGDDVTNRIFAGQGISYIPQKWVLFAGIQLQNLAAGASNSNWLIWSILANGASSQYWHNSISYLLGNAGTQALDGLTLGADFSGGTLWKGYINNIICASLSDADRILMQTAINSYWAVY